MKYFTFFLLIFSFSSCSKKSEIIGKWKLHDIDYSEFYKSMPVEMKGNFEENMKIQFAELKDKVFFIFNNDQSLQIIFPSETNPNAMGKWSFSEKRDSLYLKTLDPESFKIVKLNEKEMILTTDKSPKRTLIYKKVEN